MEENTYNQAPNPTPVKVEDEAGGINFVVIKLWLVRIMRGWYLFVISLAICMAIAYFKNRKWQPMYRSSAQVIIEEGKGLSGAQAALLQGTSVERGFRNVNNQMIIFGSQNLVAKVIESQPDLQIDYFTQGRFKNTNLYKMAPIRITTTYVSPSAYYRSFQFTDLGDSLSFEIFCEGTKNVPELRIRGQYGVPFENSLFFLQVDKTMYYRPSASLYFRLYDVEQLASEYSSRVSFDFPMKGASVVQVTTTGSVPERDCDFLNGLCQAFLDDNLFRKNETAVKTIEFIDSQLEILSDSLRMSEDRLKGYKASNPEVANGGSSSLLSKYNQLEGRQSEMRLQNSYLDYLTNYLKEGIEDGNIITPTSLGVSDPTLIGLVSQFTETQIKRKDVGEKSPLYAKYTREMEVMKEQMYQALNNLRVTMGIQQNDLNSRFAVLNAEIQSMPYKEQQLLNIQRKFKMNDDYYNFLIQKRAEAQIQKASNTPDNIILDKARTNAMINANVKSKTMSTCLLLGLLIPLGIIVLYNLLIPYVRTEEEVIKQTEPYPLLGVVRHTRSSDPLVVLKHPNSAVTETFRALRTKLAFLVPSDKMVLTLTSSESGDGKSYLSVNMAAIMAITGKKTLLIDMDLRKPSINTLLSVVANQGLSNCLTGQAEVDDVIMHLDQYPFDLLPVGPTPPNPGELLKSPRFSQILAKLRERYQYIIIDSSPIGLVADSYDIVRLSDIVLYAVRCEKTNKEFLGRVVNQMQSNGVTNVHVVFNDVNFKKLEYNHYYSHYGQYNGYGRYGYYGTYGRGHHRKSDNNHYYNSDDDI